MRDGEKANIHFSNSPTGTILEKKYYFDITNCITPSSFTMESKEQLDFQNRRPSVRKQINRCSDQTYFRTPEPCIPSIYACDLSIDLYKDVLWGLKGLDICSFSKQLQQLRMLLPSPSFPCCLLPPQHQCCLLPLRG